MVGTIALVPAKIKYTHPPLQDTRAGIILSPLSNLGEKNGSHTQIQFFS